MCVKQTLAVATVKGKSDRHRGMGFAQGFAVSHAKPEIKNKCQVTHSWILSAWPLLQVLLCASPGGEKKRQPCRRHVSDTHEHNGSGTALSAPSFPTLKCTRQ